MDTDEDFFDKYPQGTTSMTQTGLRPIFNVTLGQGLNKVIRQDHVEFTEDIICQRITVRGINVDANNFILYIQRYPDGHTISFQSNDMITLRRVTWFRETKYRIYALDDNGAEHDIAQLSISWSSRTIGHNTRSDFISLVAIQGDPDLSLPKRSFWYFWNRMGLGINAELETYRHDGSLGPIKDHSAADLFPGIRSVLEHGSDDQVTCLVYFLCSLHGIDPDRFRFSGKKKTNCLDLAELIKDVSIIFGYEYPIPDYFLMYFRN